MSDYTGPWTCEDCGTENQEQDEHCTNCDTWRSDQEDEDE